MALARSSLIARLAPAGLVASALAAAVLATISPQAAAEGFPPSVKAVYRISFGGFDIGSMMFNSTLGPNGYTLQSSAEMSALLGAFTWKGSSRSTGTVAEQAPKPAAYNFDYKANSKQGSVKMAFNGAGVQSFNAVPPQDPHPTLIPLKEQHLRDVLDPLSAVMALTRAQGANPCGRKLSIFDGKQRFDLVMSFRRQQKIIEARPSGQPGFAFVCHVRYVPIAGYKMNNETKQMASNGNIEIALRPVPSANLLVPYQVTIPTIAGAATLTAQRIEIQTPNKGQIALVH